MNAKIEEISADYTTMEGYEMLAAVGTDAHKWAIAFNQTAVKLGYSNMDEGWLIGWFANAMMQMHDHVLTAGSGRGTAPVVLDDGSAFFVATV